MTDLEQEAEKFRQEKKREKEAADRAALRFYMGCAASGLLSKTNGYVRPEEIANNAAEIARALLKKELEGF